MEKNLVIGKLNDTYGFLLTGRQREIVDAYYNYDFSLREIAENQGVTRQAVLDGLKKAEGELLLLEKKLRLFRLNALLATDASKLDRNGLLRLIDEARLILTEVE